MDKEDQVNLDKCLLPEDSSVREPEKSEYEVSEILDCRTGKKMR